MKGLPEVFWDDWGPFFSYKELSNTDGYKTELCW